MDQEQTLKARLAKFLDKEESDINELIINMDFKDLVRVNTALKANNKEQVLNILHGYGL